MQFFVNVLEMCADGVDADPEFVSDLSRVSIDPAATALDATGKEKQAWKAELLAGTGKISALPTVRSPEIITGITHDLYKKHVTRCLAVLVPFGGGRFLGSTSRHPACTIRQRSRA